jgi:hypothetical protein
LERLLAALAGLCTGGSTALAVAATNTHFSIAIHKI